MIVNVALSIVISLPKSQRPACPTFGMLRVLVQYITFSIFLFISVTYMPRFIYLAYCIVVILFASQIASCFRIIIITKLSTWIYFKIICKRCLFQMRSRFIYPSLQTFLICEISSKRRTLNLHNATIGRALFHNVNTNSTCARDDNVLLIA